MNETLRSAIETINKADWTKFTNKELAANSLMVQALVDYIIAMDKIKENINLMPVIIDENKNELLNKTEVLNTIEATKNKFIHNQFV